MAFMTRPHAVRVAMGFSFENVGNAAKIASSAAASATGFRQPRFFHFKAA